MTLETPSLAEIFTNPRKFNNLIPSLSIADVPSGVAFRYGLVYIDPDPDEGEVYEVQAKKNKDGDWVKHYALHKSALNKLLGAAGASALTDFVQEIPGKVDVKQARVRVRHRGVDGTYREFDGTFDLDIPAQVISHRARLEKELAVQGKIRRQIWEKKEKVWREYVGEQAQGVIEREIAEREAQIRAFSGAVVETKALLRAIKGIMNVKESYPDWRLKLPFVVYWFQFPPAFTPEEASAALYPRTGSRPSTPPVMSAATVPASAAAPPVQSDGSHLVVTGTPSVESREKAVAGKPSVAERMKLLLHPAEGGGLSTEEIRELVSDVCLEKGIPVPKATDPNALKGFLRAVTA